MRCVLETTVAVAFGTTPRRARPQLSEVDDRALARDVDPQRVFTRELASMAEELLDLGIGTCRIVMEEHQASYVRGARELDAVLVRSVTERAARRELARAVLGIVEQHIGIVREFECVDVQHTQAERAATQILWRVIGEIRDRVVAVADAVAERATTFVRDLAGQHVESFDATCADVERFETPAAA